MSEPAKIDHICAKIRELDAMCEAGAIRGFVMTRGERGYLCEIKLNGLPTYEIALKTVPGLSQVIFDQSGALFSTGMEGFYEGDQEELEFSIKVAK